MGELFLRGIKILRSKTTAFRVEMAKKRKKPVHDSNGKKKPVFQHLKDFCDLEDFSSFSIVGGDGVSSVELLSRNKKRLRNAIRCCGGWAGTPYWPTKVTTGVVGQYILLRVVNDGRVFVTCGITINIAAVAYCDAVASGVVPDLIDIRKTNVSKEQLETVHARNCEKPYVSRHACFIYAMGCGGGWE